MGVFSRFLKKRPVPEIEFAALGFAQVAITRRHAPEINLYALERGIGEELLREGCSLEQALSARWGGAYAITADLFEFYEAVEVFKDTMEEAVGKGTLKTKTEAEGAYRAAAAFVMGRAHVLDPKEYGRFLSYIGVS